MFHPKTSVKKTGLFLSLFVINHVVTPKFRPARIFVFYVRFRRGDPCDRPPFPGLYAPDEHQTATEAFGRAAFNDRVVEEEPFPEYIMTWLQKRIAWVVVEEEPFPEYIKNLSDCSSLQVVVEEEPFPEYILLTLAPLTWWVVVEEEPFPEYI